MKKRTAALVLAAILGVALSLAAGVRPATASPGDRYSGTHFGAGNLPTGCVANMSTSDPANQCYHQRTGMNGLDSPEVDVLILVPVSPAAERDMRIMRQVVDMWEGGIDYLAEQMALDWLGSGMNFHISVDYVDPTGEGGEFTTYPIVDPEIVIVASNPVGGAGIGIDPIKTGGSLLEIINGEGSPLSDGEVPCNGIANPFDFEYWENVPGFDRHHEERMGTYVEDCEGAGGNICVAVNGAIDPNPSQTDDGVSYSLFDLVAHEFGHCLTIGHVGDGAEGSWGLVPTNDIMSYNSDPKDRNKCVSTLDVESVALTMSRYLDVDGDGSVTADDRLFANDPIGVGDPNSEGSNPFQVQAPRDHAYASTTGDAVDCPQPDLSPVPGAPRTDWTPTAVDDRPDGELTIATPTAGASSADGRFGVTGSLERPVTDPEGDITSSTASVDDADDDATSPLTEIQALDAEVTATTVEVTMSMAEVWPSLTAASPVSYTAVIDGHALTSFVRYAVDENPMTYSGTEYLPSGTSTWDTEARTVSFHVPQSYLDGKGIIAPYHVSAIANHGSLTASADDTAPDTGTLGVTTPASSAARTARLPLAQNAQTVTFEQDGNTFYPDQTDPTGLASLTGLGGEHGYSLKLDERSTVELTLAWPSESSSDLDLRVGGAASSTDGASSANPEHVVLEHVKGVLNLTVSATYVSDPDGTTYTLTAVVTPEGSGDETADTAGDGLADDVDECPAKPGPAPSGCGDSDRDGVNDADDTCPELRGDVDGCRELVTVSVDGVEVGRAAVDTMNGASHFSLPITVEPGSHDVTVEWTENGAVVDADTVTVTRPEPECVSKKRKDSDKDKLPNDCDPDDDNDTVADEQDNCPIARNPDQADFDGDGQGDRCDNDRDGDGFTNEQERKAKTRQNDPLSHP